MVSRKGQKLLVCSKKGIVNYRNHITQPKVQVDIDAEKKSIQKSQKEKVITNPNFEMEKVASGNKFEKESNLADGIIQNSNMEPKIQGGEDEDGNSRKRRDHVKEVGDYQKIF